MDTSNGPLLSLLTVFVALIALAMVVQSIALLVFVVSIRKHASRLMAVVEQINHDIQPLIQSSREIIAEGREKFTAISKNLVDITEAVKEQVGVIKAQITRIDGVITDVSQKTREQVERIDGIVSEASERVRVQFMRLDQLVTDGISRVQETGEAVRSSIMAPVREVSAILSGVRTTLDFLFRRNKTGMDHATEDEELFI